MSQRMELVVSWLLLVLAMTASTAGLVFPGIYRDAAVLLPQLYGQDAVTLMLGVPLLAVGMVGVARGSVRGRVVWLGALGYLLYAYATYAFGLVWNPLFLLYTALLGLSLYAFIFGLAGTSAEGAARALGRMPRRTVAWFLIATAGVFTLLWLADEVGALLRGELPRSVEQMEIPTNFIHVMDLAIVLPALALAGWLLLKERAWGWLLGGVLLAKAFTLAAAVAAMGWFSARAGFPTDIVLSGAFVVVTLAAGALLGLALRRPARTGSRAHTAARGAPAGQGR